MKLHTNPDDFHELISIVAQEKSICMRTCCTPMKSRILILQSRPLSRLIKFLQASANKKEDTPPGGDEFPHRAVLL